MAKHTPLKLAAILLATTVAAASAQTAQDHAAHHPANSARATSDATAPPRPGSPGGTTAMGQNGGGTPMMNMGSMMDGGMGQMMQMMGAMQSGGGGTAMMPFTHTEGRIAFIKAELAITDAQTPQWNAFADALRAGSKAMRETMANMAKAQPEKPWTAADRTDAMMQMMSARLEGMKAIATAEKALYAVLTDTQKQTADELLGGPMMGMGGRM